MKPQTADTVAVVVPTFDRSSVLLRAIESVVAQTRPADQILVVDDGSTDGTADLLRRASLPISVISQKNRGVSAARNRGLAATDCEWIAFLDSDDEWLPQKLERQLEALGAAPLLPGVKRYRVCHTEETWIRRGNQVLPRRVHKKRGGWIFRHCLPRCAISPSSVMIHRQVFDRVGGFDQDLPACEDYDLWLRVCSRYPVLLVDEPLVIKHGGHSDQLSRRIPSLDRYRIRALEKALASEWASNCLEPGDHAAARAQLIEKLEIYVRGAEKRGRAAAVETERQRLTELRAQS